MTTMQRYCFACEDFYSDMVLHNIEHHDGLARCRAAHAALCTQRRCVCYLAEYERAALLADPYGPFRAMEGE